MAELLLPSGGALDHLETLRNGDPSNGLRDDVLEMLPMLLWLLDHSLRGGAVVSDAAVHDTLEGLLKGRGRVRRISDRSGWEGVAVIDAREDPSGWATLLPDLLGALRGDVLDAVVALGVEPGVEDLARADAAAADVADVGLVLGGCGSPVRLLGPKGRGPVAQLAALSVVDLDRWSRLHSGLGSALVGNRRSAGRQRTDVEGDRLRGELLDAYAQLDRIITSPSWRLTGPLRAFVRRFPLLARILRSAARGVLRLISREPWRTQRGRNERYGHAESAVELARDLTTRTSGSLQRDKQEGHVGWVASVGDPFTTRYRVSNLSAALRGHGIRSSIVASDGFDAGLLAACESVVLCRVAWDDGVAREVERLRESGTRIIFDIDDLAFDPTRVELTHPQAGREAYRRHLFARHRATLLESDAVTVSTAPLRNEVSTLGRPTAVVPNNLGIDVLERWMLGPNLSSEDPAGGTPPPDRRSIRLAYLSGTATHAHDVREMTTALAEVMRIDERIELHVVGPVDLPSDLERLRVVRHPLQRHHDMLALLSTMDVNLAPLELGNAFTDAKSELKIFEAACVGVPTIASPTRPYAATVEHGRTGMLAADPGQWKDALLALTADSGLRRRLGAAAFGTIVPRFAAPAIAGVSSMVLASAVRTDKLVGVSAPGEAGRGSLGLLLPDRADWADLREAIVGLAQDPGSDRCKLLIASGDPNATLLRQLLAALSHGDPGAGVPELVTLSVTPSSPPAARAASAISESGCSALGVLPEGAVLASGAVSLALGALERTGVPVVVGVRVDDGGAESPLRCLMLDADLADRPADRPLRDHGGLHPQSMFLPVLARDWAAEHPSVFAALVAGEQPGRVVLALATEGVEVRVIPRLRGSTRVERP